MKTMSRYHSMNRPEQEMANMIGQVIAPIIYIVWYIIKKLSVLTWKFKKGLIKLSLSIIAIIICMNTLTLTVSAPKPTYAYIETPKTEYEKIHNYIIEVFKEDSDKAFQLLTQCGENKALNPNAVNTAGNTPKGSRDIGVFQINEYWQKTQGKFLFNYKVNIEVAHQLFEENGKSFKLWTGGRNCGI